MDVCPSYTCGIDSLCIRAGINPPVYGWDLFLLYTVAHILVYSSLIDEGLDLSV